MEKIPSFTIDHNRLQRGIFLSRQDRTSSGDTVSTFDIRMTLPNREPALSPQALHAMEHLAATYLRNDREWKDRIIYWGPMGCCTGNYLLLSGDFCSEEVLPLMRRTMQFVAEFEGKFPVRLRATAATIVTWICLRHARQHAAISLRCLTPRHRTILSIPTN